MKCQFKGTPINEALVRDLAGRSWKRQDPSRHCHRPQLHPRLEAESRNARQRPDCRLSGPQEPRPGTKVSASKIAPDLPIKGGTKVAAPSKKRTGGLPTGSFFRREAKNPVRADRKPLPRYGAMEGALARGLLLLIAERRQAMDTRPSRSRPGLWTARAMQGPTRPQPLSLSQPSTSIDPLTSCSGPAGNILR